MSIEDLILRHLQGRTTPSEEAELLAWRQSSPENEDEYHAVSGLWSLVSVASPIEALDIVPDADGVIAEADGYPSQLLPTPPAIPLSAARGRRMSAPPSARGSEIPWLRNVVVGALAASLAAVGFGVARFSGAPSAPAGDFAYRTVTTTADAGVTLTLFDGTAVRLAPSSELEVVDVGANPVVRLRGRAYFGVVPNPDRTFTVQTEHGDATALGTRFEVLADADELQVLVVQGNVRVSAASSAVELGEGMMSRNAEHGPLSTSRVEDVDARLDWVGHTFVFRATPLRKVIMEIQRRYDVTVTLEEVSLAPLEVTAVFTDQPIEDVVFVICRIVGARCAVDQGRFRIGVQDDATGILGTDAARQN